MNVPCTPARFRFVTSRDYFPAGGGEAFQIQNTDRLLGGAWGLRAYPGLIGVKNGYTTDAGNTFTGAATRAGRTLLVTVMHPGNSADAVYEEAAALLDWGFAPGASARAVGTLVEPVSEGRGAEPSPARGSAAIGRAARGPSAGRLVEGAGTWSRSWRAGAGRCGGAGRPGPRRDSTANDVHRPYGTRPRCKRQSLHTHRCAPRGPTRGPPPPGAVERLPPPPWTWPTEALRRRFSAPTVKLSCRQVEHKRPTGRNGADFRIPFVQVDELTSFRSRAQPRPTYGIAVASTVANCTFASSGSSAMCRTVRATSATSITGSGATSPFA